MFSLLILLAIASLAAVIDRWRIGAYNGLNTTRNVFKSAFAQIGVQLQLLST